MTAHRTLKALAAALAALVCMGAAESRRADDPPLATGPAVAKAPATEPPPGPARPAVEAAPRPLDDASTCGLGDAQACMREGTRLKDGTGRPRDPASARRLFAMACDLGVPQGCNDLGFLNAMGDGGPEDKQIAVTLFDRACRAGYLNGCLNQGILISRTQPRVALELYRSACDRGLAKACYNLAMAYDEGTLAARDLVIAELHFRRACDAGEIRGCEALLVARDNHRAAIRFPPTPERLAQLTERCQNRQPVACNELGMMHATGEGMAVNAGRAFELLRRACEGDLALGCFNLGTFYASGSGVRVDRIAASALFQRACTGGHQLSCHTMAENHVAGDGVPVNVARAREMFARLCEGGRISGCLSLAKLEETHEQGLGVAEALRWHRAALAIDPASGLARQAVARLETARLPEAASGVLAPSCTFEGRPVAPCPLPPVGAPKD